MINREGALTTAADHRHYSSRYGEQMSKAAAHTAEPRPLALSPRFPGLRGIQDITEVYNS